MPTTVIEIALLDTGRPQGRIYDGYPLSKPATLDFHGSKVLRLSLFNFGAIICT